MLNEMAKEGNFDHNCLSTVNAGKIRRGHKVMSVVAVENRVGLPASDQPTEDEFAVADIHCCYMHFFPTHRLLDPKSGPFLAECVMII